MESLLILVPGVGKARLQLNPLYIHLNVWVACRSNSLNFTSFLWCQIQSMFVKGCLDCDMSAKVASSAGFV